MISFKQFINESKKIIAYHGSKDVIDDFKYDYTNKGNDQLGSGFYFTTDKNEAKSYGKNVHEVELTLDNPIDAEKIGNLSIQQAKMFIKNAPNYNEDLMNWGDVDREGEEKVLKTASEAYAFKNRIIVRALFNLANDFYRDETEEFNKNVKKILGFDSLYKKHENGAIHYVAFFPSQIKILKIVPE
ncbi:DUF3990 domain-containing protein [archaeon]|nr:DUF3990 domain-containing protein [archaeon]NCQ51357.1 DUF3990 domain-containing protein [archaeon]NCT58817.1 DUF3990 domain-containing protein [archaeon]